MLASCKNIEELSLYVLNEAMLRELAGFPNLRCLTLHDSNAPAAAYEVLGQLTKLEDVTLEEIKEDQGAAILSALAKLPNLQALRVDWRAATSDDLEKIGKLPKLKRLSISNVEGLNSNEGLSKLTNIQELQLEGGRIFDDQGLKLLEGLDQLEGLDIASTNVTGSAELKGLKNLKWLRNSYGGRQFNDVIKEKRPELRVF
jgi:hypothetical protein